MTISVTNFTGSVAVTTVEMSLTSGTTATSVSTTVGCYQAFIDVSALSTGDIYEVRIYEKARAADTQRLAMTQTIAYTQSTPIHVTPTLILGAGWDIRLIELAGASRTIPYSIRGVT